MRSLDIRTIQVWVNNTQSVFLPDFSEILDISFDEWGNNLNILYQYDYVLAGTNQKMFNIWVVDSKNIIKPPSDHYKFFGVAERRYSEVNLGVANNGKVVPVESIVRIYIFIEEIKTTAENREEKLNEIL